MRFKTQITAIIKERSSVQVNVKPAATGFSKKTKLSIAWGFGVLVINTVNLLSYEIIQVVIMTQYIKTKHSCVYEAYSFFCVFWVDILIFTNGIGFLFLFKAIAQSGAKKPSRESEQDVSSDSQRQRSMTEMMNGWKRRDYATQSIKKLLQTQTGHFSALSSNNSTSKWGSIHQNKNPPKMPSSTINEGSEY